MNSKLSLVLVATAAVAGLAFAQVASQQDPMERLATLESEVAALKTEVAELKKSAANATTAQELAATRATVDALASWARTQSQSGESLQAVLDDARTKGFTQGINPDSRDALLKGFSAFATALHTDAFNPPPPAPPVKKPL